VFVLAAVLSVLAALASALRGARPAPAPASADPAPTPADPAPAPVDPAPAPVDPAPVAADRGSARRLTSLISPRISNRARTSEISVEDSAFVEDLVRQGQCRLANDLAANDLGRAPRARKSDSDHTGTVGITPGAGRPRRNVMKPRIHCALTHWKSGFIASGTGLALMINLG
jgi:hypothetical protein